MPHYHLYSLNYKSYLIKCKHKYEALTFLVRLRSNSMDFILSQDSSSMRSFSGGISARLLLSSWNTASSLWRRCKQGLTGSSLTGFGVRFWSKSVTDASKGWTFSNLLLSFLRCKIRMIDRTLTKNATNALAMFLKNPRPPSTPSLAVCLSKAELSVACN